jgi:general secretion pathway protein H
LGRWRWNSAYALLEDAQFAVVPADDEMLADPRAQENIRAAVRLADGNQILVNAELDDVLVYEITRMIIENGELSPLPYEKIADVSSRPPFKGPIVGLHPGAMRYYREHGQELSKPGELEIAGEEQSPTNHPAEPSAPSRHPPDLRSLNAATSLIADALRTTRLDAISRHEEGVFVIDVEKRIFATSLGGSPTSLEPGVEILLYTAESEMIDDSKGGIRFFADGSSTGGQIDLIYSGDNAAISVDWRHGVVTVTSDGPSASR